MLTCLTRCWQCRAFKSGRRSLLSVLGLVKAWIAVIVASTIATYIPVTLLVTEYRGKARKQMNKMDNDKTQRAMDMLLCVEAVKSFGMEERELQSFASAIDKFQVGFSVVVFVHQLTQHCRL